jgi:uncharacterized protein YyaL (SSP411 family)
MRTFRLLPVLACAVLVAASCRTAGGPASGAPACEAVEALPGSEPLPASLRAAIAAAHVPEDAPQGASRICNRLVLEPGAFARLHALDPIDWRPWSPALLGEAETLGRPLLVMTGFASSPGCREMAGEVFAAEGLAPSLNHGFVPVLVDRDERPDVDAYLMEAVGLLAGAGGWPTVVVMDAQARPFDACSWGATPGGCRSLKSLVDGVLRRLALGSGSIGERAERTAERMQKRASIDASAALPDAATVSDTLREYLADEFDADSATFSDPPLFPRAPALRFLLGRRGDAEAAAMASSLLENLPGSDLRDPGSGAYFRYAAAEQWTTPSREKLLADNAVLASAFLDAAVVTGRADFREAARGILDFLLERLRLPGGAFGLGESMEGRRDDRVLADANALAISVLVQAGRVLGESRYLEAAVAAANFVDAGLRRGGRVLHVGRADGSTGADGYLADAALLGLAFLDLDGAGAAGATKWREAARAIADDLERRFEHENSGGFFQTASDAEALPLRFKPVHDAAVPSGNSAAALLFTRLARKGEEARYGAVARRTFEAFAEVLTLRPLVLPSMVSALQEWAEGQASDPPQLDPAPAVQP